MCRLTRKVLESPAPSTNVNGSMVTIKQHLERSLAYYLRGFELTKEKGWAEDQGYNAINAAFVLDLLAVQENDEARKAGTVSEIAVRRFAEAEALRREIVKDLPPLLKIEKHQLDGSYVVGAGDHR